MCARCAKIAFDKYLRSLRACLASLCARLDGGFSNPDFREASRSEAFSAKPSVGRPTVKKTCNPSGFCNGRIERPCRIKLCMTPRWRWPPEAAPALSPPKAGPRGPLHNQDCCGFLPRWAKNPLANPYTLKYETGSYKPEMHADRGPDVNSPRSLRW